MDISSKPGEKLKKKIKKKPNIELIEIEEEIIPKDDIKINKIIKCDFEEDLTADPCKEKDNYSTWISLLNNNKKLLNEKCNDTRFKKLDLIKLFNLIEYN